MLGRFPAKSRYGSAGFGAAERQRLGLGEQVRHQQVVVVAVRVVRVGEADEVGRHDPGALVQQLVERVLAVGARLAPHDRAGVDVVTGEPSSRTDLPFDSMSSCCR